MNADVVRSAVASEEDEGSSEMGFVVALSEPANVPAFRRDANESLGDEAQ